MSDAFRVKGLAELDNALRQLPDKIQMNVLRGAMRAGAKVFAQAAVAAAPRRSGRLKRSIRYSARFDRKRGMPVGSSSAGRGGKGRPLNASAFYARLVERGTAPHMIWPRSPNTLLAIGRPYAKHPGTRANPFMASSFAIKKGDAVLVAANYIRKRLLTKHGIEVSETGLENESAP